MPRMAGRTPVPIRIKGVPPKFDYYKRLAQSWEAERRRGLTDLVQMVFNGRIKKKAGGKNWAGAGAP